MTSCVYEWIDSEFPTWVDSYEPAWSLCYPGRLYSIYTDSDYVYAAYSDGLYIIDILSELNVAYINYTYGFTSVCGDDTNIYLGTLTNGVLCLDKTTVSGNSASPYCLDDKYFSANLHFPIQANKINHLFSTNNNLSIVTLEGIDIINFSGQGYRSYTTVSGVTKSFLTNKNELYYISHDDSYRYQINKINSVMCDWTIPDCIYKVGDSFLQDNINLTDIYITENTSSVNGNNTIFVATTSGCYVYDEGTTNFEVYYHELHVKED